MLRHKVKAGITGWAQVHGWRGNTSIRKRIEYDLYYIENWSLALDFKILWMTAAPRPAPQRALKSIPPPLHPSILRSVVRRIARSAAALVAAGCAAACGGGEPAAPAPVAAGSERPSILLITVDTLRADHLSSWGYPRTTSPAVDALAREGVRFDLRLGAVAEDRPVVHLDVHRDLPEGQRQRPPGRHLPASCKFRMLAEELQRAGYATHAVVANGALGARLLLRPGVRHLRRDLEDDAEGTPTSSAPAPRRSPTSRSGGGRALRRRPAVLPLGPLRRSAQPVLAAAAVPRPLPGRRAFRRRERGAGLRPADAGDGRHRRRQVLDGDDRLAFYVARYDAEIAYADAEIGRLLDGAARGAGCSTNTLTAFTSDHGESLGEHQLLLRARHGSASRPASTCRSLFHWPGHLAPRVDEAPAELIDLAPTLLEAAGAASPDGRWAQGRSLWPRLRGEEAAAAETHRLRRRRHGARPALDPRRARRALQAPPGAAARTAELDRRRRRRVRALRPRQRTRARR